MSKKMPAKLGFKKWLMFMPAVATFFFAWSGQTLAWMDRGTGPT